MSEAYTLDDIDLEGIPPEMLDGLRIDRPGTLFVGRQKGGDGLLVFINLNGAHIVAPVCDMASIAGALFACMAHAEHPEMLVALGRFVVHAHGRTMKGDGQIEGAGLCSCPVCLETAVRKVIRAVSRAIDEPTGDVH